MKTFVLIFCSFTGLAWCENQEEKLNKIASESTNYTTIQWIDSVKNIGYVNAGTKTEIEFRFKNSGAKPLFIIAAKPGCGCTVADSPDEAIAPNGEGLITAEYYAHTGTPGGFRKSIAVTANTKSSTVHNIFFYGEIKKESGRTTAGK